MLGWFIIAIALSLFAGYMGGRAHQQHLENKKLQKRLDDKEYYK
jgi:hypothetical protein